MTITSLERLCSDQTNLLQNIKTCNEDLVHHRITSDSSIRRTQQTLQQDSTEATTIMRRLANVIQSADHDLQRQLLGSEEWSTGTEDEIERRFHNAQTIAERYEQDFTAITNAFDSLAERSKLALQDALGLSQDATVFQVTRVAPINQQRRTILKDLQDSVSAARINVEILADKKIVLERQITRADDLARAAGLEVTAQGNKRENGVIVRYLELNWT